MPCSCDKARIQNPQQRCAIGQFLDDAINKRSDRIRNGYDLPEFMSRNVDETGSRTYNDGKEGIKHGRKAAEHIRESEEEFRQRTRGEILEITEGNRDGSIFVSRDTSRLSDKRSSRTQGEAKRLGFKNIIPLNADRPFEIRKGNLTTIAPFTADRNIPLKQ